MKQLSSLLLAVLLVLCLSACGRSEAVPTEPDRDTTADAPTVYETTHIHSFSPATCTTPELCACGETRGEARGHNPSKATCVSRGRCYTCGETLEPALGHDYVDGICTRCRIEDVHYVPEYITFQDPFLENYVKQALGIAGDQQVSVPDMKKLIRFTIKEGVTDVQDLKYAINLESVTINASHVRNLDVLKDLPVHTVELGFRAKIDVSFLRDMHNVTTVFYNNCEIAGGTLNDVISSENLTIFHFYDPDNTNLDFLANAPAITELELSLSFGANTDFSVLLNLPNLKSLEVSTFNSLSAAQNDVLAALMSNGVLVEIS